MLIAQTELLLQIIVGSGNGATLSMIHWFISGN